MTMENYAAAEYASWSRPVPTCCAWCGRANGLRVPLMSTEHFACAVCYSIWYEYEPMNSEHLRKMSLGPVGKGMEGRKL